MEMYIQTNAEGRVVASMPLDTPYSKNGFFVFDMPETLEHALNDYKIVEGELVYEEAPENAAIREENEAVLKRIQFLADAPDTIEDLIDAVMELAAMIGGEE